MSETWTNMSQNLLRIDFWVLAGSTFTVYKGISRPQFDFLHCKLKVKHGGNNQTNLNNCQICFFHAL